MATVSKRAYGTAVWKEQFFCFLLAGGRIVSAMCKTVSSMLVEREETKGAVYQLDVEAAVKKYGDMVYRLAVVKTNQRADAEDVFSEVFYKLFQHRDRICSDEHLKAWLLRVTMQCANKQHASSWHKNIILSDQHLETAAQMEERFPEENIVLPAVQKLPEKYRDVLHLYYWEGYTIPEMATLLGKKENTIKSLMFRAREKLRIRLPSE